MGYVLELEAINRNRIIPSAQCQTLTLLKVTLIFVSYHHEKFFQYRNKPVEKGLLLSCPSIFETDKAILRKKGWTLI